LYVNAKCITQVAELTSRPDDSRWADFSIEFCGGTHLENTADAKAFVITGEVFDFFPPKMLFY
jgi:hypothetical protein